ncbi:MAG TPA: hypothetical protein DEQ34_04230 [Balneolaceae bacterium]|nr:hypothetical protein [Balneolaceae bacterium]|tara:strand:- start:3427 stop:4161 length:735 start_codon:yes stop_codon:yes gene_type:complete
MRISQFLLTVTVLFALLLCLEKPVNAQMLERSYQLGGGTYTMQSLKNLQDDVQQGSSPIYLRSTKNFPTYFTFELKLGRAYRNIFRGAFLRMESTGSRLSYSDRTGFVAYDQIASALMIGAYMKIPIRVKDDFDLRTDPHLYYEPRLGLVFNYVEFISKSRIMDSSSKSVTDAVSMGLMTMHSIGYNMSYKRLNFAPFLGVLIDPIERPLHLTDNRKAVLLTQDNEKLRTRWLGLRFGIELSLR